MFRLYMQENPYDLLVRVGHTFATLSKARAKAKALRAAQVEIRNESLPRSRSLCSIFVEGQEIVS